MFPFANAQEKTDFQSRKVQDVWNHHNQSLAGRDIEFALNNLHPIAFAL
jgi:hypothetical protein